MLRDVSLSVAAGDSIAITGPSGSGKSTLLKSINRLLDLTEGAVVRGAVLIDGAPVNSCTLLAAQVQGKLITTIEGLGVVAGPNTAVLAVTGLVLAAAPAADSVAIARLRQVRGRWRVDARFKPRRVGAS